MSRKGISKSVRQKVYEKYNGHCAYCGCKLELKDMQVDHIESLYKYESAYSAGNAGFLDDIENLMPACRQCNFYKSTYGIEEFRERMQTITERLEKQFIYRLAEKYGIVREEKKSIKFYFEKFERCDMERLTINKAWEEE